MNTRLQVEHPVTEAITGIDLVEQMIRVAAGEALSITQDDVKIDGWSIENRVYAEDPYRGFLPSTGRLVRYRPPVPGWADDGAANGRRGVAGVRVDDGVYEGGEVSMFYDPMIAKLVTWGETRDEAADRQIAALDSFQIEGLGHNVDFVSAIMQHPRFRAGELTTGFIAEEYPDGFHGAPADEDLLAALAAIAAGMSFSDAARAHLISDQLGEPVPPPCDWTVRIDGRDFQVTLGEGHALVDGERIEGGLDWAPGDWLATATANDAALTIIVSRRRSGWLLATRGARHQVTVYPAHIAALSRFMLEKVPPDLSRFLICPMPGLLTRLDVGTGDKVEAGQPLAVVEAMKMENILRAEKAGTVKAVNAKPGDSLAVDAIIMEFE
jgi:propionyl-CoA carboxylase alpha chain